jgi:hypothetical protein
MNRFLFRLQRLRPSRAPAASLPDPRAVIVRLSHSLRTRCRPHPGTVLLQLAPTRALGVTLLMAVALHLLALSALQLRQRREPPMPSPEARDDTPELLLFSRAQTREPAITPLSLSSLSQLPPPPPLQAPQAPRSSDAASAFPRRDSGTTTRRERAAHQATQSRRLPAPEPRARDAAGPSRRPRAGSARPPAPSSLATALAAARGLPASGSDLSAPAVSEDWPTPQQAQGETLETWTRLWGRAEAANGVASGRLALRQGEELRRLPLGDGELPALPESRRLALRFGDRRLLIWADGRQLWLLQAPAIPVEQDAEQGGA